MDESGLKFMSRRKMKTFRQARADNLATLLRSSLILSLDAFYGSLFGRFSYLLQFSGFNLTQFSDFMSSERQTSSDCRFEFIKFVNDKARGLFVRQRLLLN